MPRLDHALSTHLAPRGLNLSGVVAVPAWDRVARPGHRSADLLPGARSIVVFGSAGPALWAAMLRQLRADPRLLADHEHPLDACVRRAVGSAAPLLEHTSHRWFFAAADETVHIDFRTLALLGGLGAHSRLGLLIHPRHGPWLGLRAAVFVDAALPASPAVAQSPCEGCAAPCMAACPAHALSSGDWDVVRCSRFHLDSDRCRDTCHSRLACPVGSASRYDDDELHYHYDRAAGRRRLRELVSLADAADCFEGSGPYWGTWEDSPAMAPPSTDDDPPTSGA